MLWLEGMFREEPDPVLAKRSWNFVEGTLQKCTGSMWFPSGIPIKGIWDHHNQARPVPLQFLGGKSSSEDQGLTLDLSTAPDPENDGGKTAALPLRLFFSSGRGQQKALPALSSSFLGDFWG